MLGTFLTLCVLGMNSVRELQCSLVIVEKIWKLGNGYRCLDCSELVAC